MTPESPGHRSPDHQPPDHRSSDHRATGPDVASGHAPLFDEALGLALRLHENPGDTALRATLERWRRRSARHEQVWAEVQDIHQLAGRALAPPARVPRRLLLGAALGAGVATLGGWPLLSQAVLTARADHRTGMAETLVVPLSGGQRITLAPETAVALDDTRHALRLLAGTLWCDLPAQTAALTVQAGVAEVTATDAVFELAEGSHGIAVDLARGRLDLRWPAGRTTMTGPEWLRLSNIDRVERGRHAVPIEPAAWRNSRLQAEAEPIASLIERIAPWMPGRIVLASPALGRQRISGVFDLKNPQAALRAMVWPHGGRVHRIGALLTVITVV